MSHVQQRRRKLVLTNGTRSSSSGPATTPQADPRRVRHACQGCKRRKSKPGPCERCRQLNNFCHFDEKLDTRRKASWSAFEIQQRQQYILHAVLHALRCNDDKDLNKLLTILRRNESPRQLAQCLLHQIQSLQERRIIAKTDIDINDVLSFAVEGLMLGTGGRRPHGPGTWNASSSFAVPPSLSEVDSQTDGHMYDAYLGSIPNYDPESQIGATASDHDLAAGSGVISQSSSSPSPVGRQPSSHVRPNQPSSYAVTPTAAVDIDAAEFMPSVDAISSNVVRPATYPAINPLTSITNRLPLAQDISTSSIISMLDDRKFNASPLLDVPIIDTGDWVAAQQIMNGFSEPQSQYVAKQVESRPTYGR